MEDRQIVKLFLDRNESAISCVQDKYGSRIQKIIYEITADFEASKECENDTYLNTWNSIPPNEPYDYLYPYLIHIAKNLALKFCRNKNAQKRKASVEELTQELLETIPGQDDEYIISDLVVKEVLNKYLRALPEEKRNVFIRRYWYQDSISEIASGYHLTESKVKVILLRCRNQLRGLLEQERISL